MRPFTSPGSEAGAPNVVVRLSSASVESEKTKTTAASGATSELLL